MKSTDIRITEPTQDIGIDMHWDKKNGFICNDRRITLQDFAIAMTLASCMMVINKNMLVWFYGFGVDFGMSSITVFTNELAKARFDKIRRYLGIRNPSTGEYIDDMVLHNRMHVAWTAILEFHKPVNTDLYLSRLVCKKFSGMELSRLVNLRCDIFPDITKPPTRLVPVTERDVVSLVENMLVQRMQESFFAPNRDATVSVLKSICEEVSSDTRFFGDHNGLAKLMVDEYNIINRLTWSININLSGGTQTTTYKYFMTKWVPF